MHLIVYVIDMNLDDLYNRITEENSILKECILYRTNSGDNFEYNVIEGRLNGEEVSINFDGEINFIKLYIKYGQFLNIKSYEERVLNFEKELKRFFSSTTGLYRLDEILLDDLIINKGEFWHREKNAYEVFEKWIVGQEKLHWFELKIDKVF